MENSFNKVSRGICLVIAIVLFVLSSTGTVLAATGDPLANYVVGGSQRGYVVLSATDMSGNGNHFSTHAQRYAAHGCQGAEYTISDESVPKICLNPALLVFIIEATKVNSPGALRPFA